MIRGKTDMRKTDMHKTDMRTVVKDAVIAAFMMALMAAILTIPVIGLRLNVESTGLVLRTEMFWPLTAILVVFLGRLILPFVRRPKLPAKISAEKIVPKIAEYRKVWIGALLIFAVTLPFTPPGGSMLTGLTMATIYMLLALGLNIVVGYAGLLDLGHAAFYAIGAYTYALLNQYYGLSFWQALPLAGAMAGFFGLVLGFPVLRLRGDYLAIVTLGFGEIVRLLLNNWDSLTGGPDGVTNISKPTLFGWEITRRARGEGETLWQFLGVDFVNTYQLTVLYFIGLFLVVVAVVVIDRLSKMPVGRAWEALREDEIACRSLGLSPTMIKLTAFSLGSMFAGFAGAFYAAYLGSVTPDSFAFIESAIILSIVVLGGMGSQRGVLLAALILTLLPELARDFAEYRMLIFGLVMVLMMIWRPQGLWPASRRRVELPTS